MTTLPTTSTYRLPRPPGSGGPTPPQGQPGSSGGGGAAPALTPADIWRVLRANVLLIVASVIVAVGIGLGLYYYLKKTDPKFRSVGQMVVNRPYYTNATAAGRNSGISGEIAVPDFDLPIEQQTQVQQILQESLWSDVLEKNTVVRGTAWFAKFEEKSRRTGESAATLAKDDLRSNLGASAVSNTKLIALSMDCANKDDAHDIVQAIGDAHIDRQRQLSYDRTSQELEVAKATQARYQRQVNQIRDRIADLNSRSPAGSSPAEATRYNYKEMEMSQLIGESVKARSAANVADAYLKTIEQQIKDGKDPYQVDLIVRNDSTITRLNALADDTEFASSTRVQLGENSREAEAQKARVAAARSKLDKETANVRAVARNQVLDSARNEAARTAAEAKAVDERINQLKIDLGEISANQAEYVGLKDELDSYKELDRNMSERVAVLQNAVRQQVASVNWSSLPTRPDSLSSPSLKFILPVAIMAGLALSLGIAFLRELSDQSVRSPRDIVRVGPMNVLGMVSRESDDPELSGVPLHEVIVTAPTSLLAEQLRQLRTRVQHAVSLDTTRTLLVTSPGPGDGKTTIAANLAAGLALNGRRILLVDANFHRPALQTLFKVGNEQGFSNVLENVANLESAVRKTATANLELLTTGPRPSNPTELLESQLFSDFIDRALEEYDHVIFDAGPLLVVSEAVALAPRVDGVVTVLRAKKNTRGMLGRVKDTLKQIKAEHVGVVLNGVQTVGGGYYKRNIKTYYDYQAAR